MCLCLFSIARELRVEGRSIILVTSILDYVNVYCHHEIIKESDSA